MRPLVSLALVLGLQFGLWSAPPPACAQGAVARTLVLRGAVTDAKGEPVVGARVSLRGSAVQSTMSGTNGRYALDVVMGTGAGLARGPFRVEVRAELGSKRLGLVGGGSVLAVEVVMLPGAPAKAEIRSNSELAVAAIATAFAQESITHAWVQADFGGGASAGGSNDLRYRDSVVLPGVALAPSNVKPEKPEKPAKIGKPPAPDTDGAARARDSVAAAKQREREQRAARQAVARSAERARLDSLTLTRAMQRRADSLAWIARRSAPKSSPSVKPRATVRREPVTKPMATKPAPIAPRVEVSPPDIAPTIAASTPLPVATSPDPRVKRIEPFVEAPIVPPADTCACRLRGTVEVVWPRPLEEGLPIRLTLDGPARQRTEVTLDMGAPREFRLGPLPCGEYRLKIEPQGKLRYALQRGGDTMPVYCNGQTQVRVVLNPVRK